MFPYKTSFKINRKLIQPIYLQLANQFIFLIQEGRLPAKTKLLGTRKLSELLGIHRKTVVACYEELELQGWVEPFPKKGTYIKSNLPLLRQTKIDDQEKVNSRVKTNFSFYKDELLEVKEYENKEEKLLVNDGISDNRLAPTIEIGRIYRSISGKKNIHQHMSYGSTYGNKKLREVLVVYLSESRGLKIKKENVLLTKGSQMGIWLSAQLLLKRNDIIVVGKTNYPSADITFLQRKAKLLRISVDKDGININELENICKKQSIKAIYVTPHHHHPTTVTLSAERRIRLLNLAKKYSFAIIEDDYDYDFNYNHAPILPLASYGYNSNVIYIGSVCKTIAPVFRIGYLIASKEFTEEASKHRRYIDRQGNALVELAFAEFIKLGGLDRHLRKIIKIYQQRRDFFCKRFKEELGEYLDFETPKGGMAVWVKLNPKYSWEEVEKEARNHYKLLIGDWRRYDFAKQHHNAIRIGFASYNEEEINQLVNRFKNTFVRIKNKRI